MIGATVDLTPKCHPEIAGDGIMWACIKKCPAGKKFQMKDVRNTFKDRQSPA